MGHKTTNSIVDDVITVSALERDLFLTWRKRCPFCFIIHLVIQLSSDLCGIAIPEFLYHRKEDNLTYIVAGGTSVLIVVFIFMNYCCLNTMNKQLRITLWPHLPRVCNVGYPNIVGTYIPSQSTKITNHRARIVSKRRETTGEMFK